MEFNKANLIKSPLNYVGGKYKLLPKILPLFPNKIETFLDLFAGGCNVGINVHAKEIIMNDKEEVVIDLMNDWKHSDTTQYLCRLTDLINLFKLSKTNEEGFKRIREYYNKENKSSIVFYAILSHAFNYQIRFNKSGDYNMPFGRNRSSFNKNMKGNFIKFNNKISSRHKFINKDFRDVNFSSLNENDFVYCDPPYLITCASYNERDGWNEDRERELLSILDDLSSKGIRFALSNVLENKGKSNNILKDWCSNYNVHYLNNTYSNCNYHAKDKSLDSTIEVLITNY